MTKGKTLSIITKGRQCAGSVSYTHLEAEYTGKGRRRHAQTISCHDCGPQLIFEEKGCILQRQKALERAAELLQSGAVLAVKGIGGYQFICLPYCETTVEQLRPVSYTHLKSVNQRSVRTACRKNCRQRAEKSVK